MWATNNHIMYEYQSVSSMVNDGGFQRNQF